MPQVVLSFARAFHDDPHKVPGVLLDRGFWILIFMIFLGKRRVRSKQRSERCDVNAFCPLLADDAEKSATLLLAQARFA